MTNSSNPELQRKMLDSAIEGLSKGFMDYNNDPILPLVQSIIEKHVHKFANLPEAEYLK